MTTASNKYGLEDNPIVSCVGIPYAEAGGAVNSVPLAHLVRLQDGAPKPNLPVIRGFNPKLVELV